MSFSRLVCLFAALCISISIADHANARKGQRSDDADRADKRSPLALLRALQDVGYWVAGKTGETHGKSQ